MSRQSYMLLLWMALYRVKTNLIKTLPIQSWNFTMAIGHWLSQVLHSKQICLQNNKYTWWFKASLQSSQYVEYQHQRHQPSLWEGGHPVLQTVGLNVDRVCRPGVASASDQVWGDHDVTIISWCYWRCWFCRRPSCLRIPVCSSWATWGEWSLLQVPSTPLIYTPSPSPSLILTLIFLSWCRYFCHFLPQHHQPSLLQHWLPSGLPGLPLVPLGHIFLPVRPAPHKHD